MPTTHEAWVVAGLVVGAMLFFAGVVVGWSLAKGKDE